MKMFLNLFKSPSFLIGISLFLLTICLALFFPFFYHIDVRTMSAPMMPPSREHWLGTNHMGFDMVSLLVRGLRSSLYVGFLAGIIATIVGTLLGVYAGFKGGWQDEVITLLTNIFVVIPQFVVLILISSSMKEGRSLTLIAVIIALTSLDLERPGRARAIVKPQKPRPYSACTCQRKRYASDRAVPDFAVFVLVCFHGVHHTNGQRDHFGIVHQHDRPRSLRLGVAGHDFKRRHA